MSKNWENLPLDIKHHVVKILDIKSRFQLGLSSKSNLHLINTISLVLESFKLIEKSGDLKMELNGNEMSSLLIHQFSKTFKNISVKTTEIQILHTSSEEPNALILGIIESIQLLGTTLKSQKLVCNGLNGSELKRILNYFDANILSNLELENCSFTEEQMSEVVLTEHWKRLKVLKMGKMDSFRRRIGDLMHMEHVELVWSTDSFVIDCVKNFIARDPPHGSTFSVTFETPMEIERITVNPGPIIKNGNFEYHILKLRMPSCFNAMLIKFYRQVGQNRIRRMKSMVCHVADDDFDEPRVEKIGNGEGKLWRTINEKFSTRLTGLE